LNGEMLGCSLGGATIGKIERSWSWWSTGRSDMRLTMQRVSFECDRNQAGE
jgi:hypothetical protein